MRSINLLRIAAEAELLRLRAMVARQGRRAAFGMAAFIFVIGVLILAEVTGWQALRLYVALAPIAATLILLGVNSSSRGSSACWRYDPLPAAPSRRLYGCGGRRSRPRVVHLP